MGEKPIKDILRNIGLTEKESDLYVCLSKHSGSKGADIAKLTGTDKAETYRLLKSLQSKGLAEATIESPARFVAVPFENILNSFLKLRKDEIAVIEDSKEALLVDWERISKSSHNVSAEKFVVIEGENKVFSRVMQAVREAKSELMISLLVPCLLQAIRFGFLDEITKNRLLNKTTVSLVTDFAANNNKIIESLENLSTNNANVNVKVPDIGFQVKPQIIIKDREELIIFLEAGTEKTTKINAKKQLMCLWTNCNTIVLSFISLFNALWENSNGFKDRLIESNHETQTPKTCHIKDAEAAQTLYYQTLDSAKEKIIIMTSAKGLTNTWINIDRIKQLREKGVQIQIMAPVVRENLEAALFLSKSFEIRHIPLSHSVTTWVDGKHLFQFKNLLSEELPGAFKNTFYSNDSNLVEKTKVMLNYLWENAPEPSAVTLESVINPTKQELDFHIDKKYDEYRKAWNITRLKFGELKEEDIIQKIIYAKHNPNRNVFSEHIDVFVGSAASAIIHPPSNLNLPKMIIQIGRFDKSSSFSGHEEVMISLWLDTGNGFSFVPVAQICNNAKLLTHRKRLYAGKPIGSNLNLVNKRELEVRVRGNTLFAGWTVPIPLFPPPNVLPPAFILFEGYGELKTKLMETLQAGRRQIIEANTFDAFVTFFHPLSKYSGPGTDGVFSRDIVVTTLPFT